MSWKISTILACFTGICAFANAQDSEKEEVPLDPVTGMKMTGDWVLVRSHCIICHSPQQFLRQKGTLSTWTEIIRWMQKSGGLWKLDPAIEKQIVTYLAANYGPSGDYRRAPIPATLMPENPYESEIKREVDAKRKAGLIPKGPPTP
jgi:hypothetical protein